MGGEGQQGNGGEWFRKWDGGIRRDGMGVGRGQDGRHDRNLGGSGF